MHWLREFQIFPLEMDEYSLARQRQEFQGRFPFHLFRYIFRYSNLTYD
jgi:hypothetical protein